MTKNSWREIENLDGLRELYDGFLFDAYGVLMDAQGPIVGGVSAWHSLRQSGKPCWILTNGSSRTLSQALQAYRAIGLEVDESEVISSGSLLRRYFQEHGLQGAPTAVLGTEGSRSLCRDAGAQVVELLLKQDFSVLVLANQTEFPFLESLDAVLTIICRRVESGKSCHLILTNPDLIYPKSDGVYGFTAGALAIMIEAGLKLRLGRQAPNFVRLGKPSALIFAEAERRAGSRTLLMIGDQLETDILGASQYGFDSVLVGTGLTRVDLLSDDIAQPTYVLPHWSS